MSDKTTSAIVGLKRELKTTREKVRELKGQSERWRNVASALRKIAALDEGQFENLLRSESLPCE
ncbi:hypothetical protein [Bradyrhizobium sp. AZCC 2289]|uniref:hypothetical protein n=1 Tax=Bradyrhizobium sp. AZCC 2289 TaxID=3117026 RepID=UPI002FF0CA8D